MYQSVLVIDDSYFDRLIASKVIQNASFAAHTVALDSARTGLEYLYNGLGDLPELIFLDICMPEISGFLFLDFFEKLPERVKSACQIVMLSSSVDPNDIKRAQVCPYVIDYLTKPLTPEKLDRLRKC